MPKLKKSIGTTEVISLMISEATEHIRLFGKMSFYGGNNSILTISNSEEGYTLSGDYGRSVYKKHISFKEGERLISRYYHLLLAGNCHRSLVQDWMRGANMPKKSHLG